MINKKYLRSGILMLSLISLTACTSTNGRESTGQYLDSTAITTKVKAKLVDRLGVSTMAYVSVNTQKGTVYLTGSVRSILDKRRATQVTYSVAGVKAVENQLQISQ